MLYYDRIDVCEGTDIIINDSCKCLVCRYNYFLCINLKFQPRVCNGFHKILQRAMTFNDVEIVTVRKNG